MWSLRLTAYTLLLLSLPGYAATQSGAVVIPVATAAGVSLEQCATAYTDEQTLMATEQALIDAQLQADRAVAQAFAQAEQAMSTAENRVVAARARSEQATRQLRLLQREVWLSAQFEDTFSDSLAATIAELQQLALASAADAVGEQLRHGADAVRAGNYAQAYHLWLPLAEQGHADAQYALGWLYHNGYGLRIDDEQAQRWWSMAGDQGHAEALFSLAMLFSLPGSGVHQSDLTALDYYFRAARLGHKEARSLLLSRMLQGDDALRERGMALLAELGTERGRERTLSADRANLRNGPGTQNEVITTLVAPQKLLELERSGRWLLVSIADRQLIGWLYDGLVTPAEDEVTAQLTLQ